MPKRSHSSSVWAKSRAVTATSCPSARRRSITGRMTSTWGLFVRSIQTRIQRLTVTRSAGRRWSARKGILTAPGGPTAIVGPRLLVLASISETLFNETAHFVREGGYPAIFVLMLLESACIPIPSEATMLFAGFVVVDPSASSAEHHLTLLGIVTAGGGGNPIRSGVSYLVGPARGPALIERDGPRAHTKPSHHQTAQRGVSPPRSPPGPL